MTHQQQAPEPCTSCKYFFADPRSINPVAVRNCHHPAAPALAKYYVTGRADLPDDAAPAVVRYAPYVCTATAVARGFCEIWTDKRDPSTLPPPPMTDTPTQQRAPQSPHNRRNSRR